MVDRNLPRIGPAEPRELVWIDCPYPIASVGFARVLQGKVQVHVGKQPPREEPTRWPSSAPAGWRASRRG